MDMEVPADGWYTFVGVALVSVAVAGVALGLPSTVPPDANAAANTIDEVSGSTYNASGSYEHDADEVRIDGKQIELRNDGGTAQASLAFGMMVWVRGDEDLGDVLRGTDPGERYDDLDEFGAAARDKADDIETNRPEWRPARGTLRVRTIVWGDERVTLVDA